ncbi:MAG: cbb3-type cytochrome c oxidase subunit I, partial [Rhizobacter sp.]|nr:cbb3-type cytochrome c oxidase subunit I [Rhizobacter sp.]
HNSLFLVAHFHNVVIGGVVFGAFAGYTLWFPKAFGFTLDERLGKASFWCWSIGFYLAFLPLYVLGLMGATRRMQHYADPGWQPLMVIALCGALVILAGIVLTIVQLVVSIRTRDERRDTSGDPWNGRTLEWSTASPPPAWNFATLPQVAALDAFWRTKYGASPETEEDADGSGSEPLPPPEPAEPLTMPRPSPVGFVIAFFAVVAGFALVWHIGWLALLGFAGVVATGLVHAWRTVNEIEVHEVAPNARGAAA